MVHSRQYARVRLELFEVRNFEVAHPYMPRKAALLRLFERAPAAQPFFAIF